MKTSLYAVYSRRYYATAGYQLFYGCLLAALTLGAAALLKMVAPSWNVVIAEYLYSSFLGITYIYLVVALFTNALSMFLAPASLCPDGVRNNRWYLLGKMGIPTARVVFVRWFVCVASAVVSFVLGYLLAVGLGTLLLFPFEAAYVPFAIKAVAVGVLTLMGVITVTMALAALVKNKFVTRLMALVTNAGWVYWFYNERFFHTLEPTMVAAVIEDFCAPQLNSLLVAGPAAVVVGYGLMMLCIRCKEYEEEGLDETVLQRLGVEADVLVLEQGPHKYHVVVSGPEVNGVENDIAVPLPEGQPAKKKGRKEKAAEDSAE